MWWWGVEAHLLHSQANYVLQGSAAWIILPGLQLRCPAEIDRVLCVGSVFVLNKFGISLPVLCVCVCVCVCGCSQTLVEPHTSHSLPVAVCIVPMKFIQIDMKLINRE